MVMTREMGTLRAFGFSRVRIVTAFLAEPVAFMLISGIIIRAARIPVARALREI
jgi:hypothetical protein